MDPLHFAGFAALMFSEEYPNCFELGFSQFLTEVFLDSDKDTIELTAVDISQAKFPEGWGDVQIEIAFVNSEGYSCGMMHRDLFDVFKLELGKTYTCFIQHRYENGGAIWVPYLNP